MSQPIVGILPLDDRPPNYEYPALLARAAGTDPRLPRKEWLGTPQRDGNLPELQRWTEEIGATADALIVAIDTLGYGGLVSSRRAPDPVEVILGRLRLLRRLKQTRPELTLLGYSVLMRISRADSAEEEKAYWAAYGARIFRMSYLEDRLAMMAGQPGDEEELAEITRSVPSEIVGDYLSGRARNHAVNRAMLEWAADGIFDYLIIPQDDTVDYGWNIAERRALQQATRRLGIRTRVSIYPGADEIGMLLLARYGAQQANLTPRIFPRYSSARAGQIITAYEDRPMEELLKAHLGPLGGSLAATPTDADLILYVNTPAESQGNGNDQYILGLTDADLFDLSQSAVDAIQDHLRSPHLQETLREMNTVQRDVAEFARALAAEVDMGRECAVVDVAFVNGADLALGEALLAEVNPLDLAGYGGWNTAGNTLGSVLAQSVVRLIQRRTGADPGRLAAHVKLLFARFVDDYLYQGITRSQVAFECLPTLGLDPSLGELSTGADAVRAAVDERLSQQAAELSSCHFAGRQIAARHSTWAVPALELSAVELPWRRLFEVKFDVKLGDVPVKPLQETGPDENGSQTQ